MNIVTRLLNVIHENHLSLREVEIEADIPTGYLSKAQGQNKSISSTRVELLYNKLNKMIGKKINPEWYITGKGDRYKGGYVIDQDDKFMRVSESTHQDSFELQMLVGLDNKLIAKKIKEIVSNSSQNE